MYNSFKNWLICYLNTHKLLSKSVVHTYPSLDQILYLELTVKLHNFEKTAHPIYSAYTSSLTLCSGKNGFLV